MRMDNFSRQVRRLVVVLTALLGLAESSQGASARWSATPVSPDWNDVRNWVPQTVPNGQQDVATFGPSSQTEVTVPTYTEIREIVFEAGAPTYNITILPLMTLQMVARGVTNNSGKAQMFRAPGGALGEAAIQFAGQAAPGDAIYIAGNEIPGAPGGRVQFLANVGGSTGRVILRANGVLDISGYTQGQSIRSLEGDGTVLLGSNRLAVAGSYTRSFFSGTMQGTGSVSFVKSGRGTVILDGSSNTTGSFYVEGGRLLINSTSGTPAGTGAITVFSGSDYPVVGGNGVIPNAVNVGTGGALLLGDGSTSTGTLTITGNLNMANNGDGTIQIMLGPNGTHSTLHRGGGTWTFSSFSQPFTVINAGAQPGFYKGVITGLAGNPGVSGSWFITGFGIAGSFSYDGAGSVDLNLVQAPAMPPQITAAQSTKTHGAAGTYSVQLPLTGTAGIEPRAPGSDGLHTITFNSNQPPHEGTAVVTSGVGEVMNGGASGLNTYVLRATDAQTVALTLSGVQVASGIVPDTTVSLSLLLGDVTGNGVVNSGDSLRTRNLSGQLVDSNNFRSDVNIDGVFNSGDAISVRNRSGNALP